MHSTKNDIEVNSLYERLGKRIKEYREKRGISQEILADQLSLTRASVVNIENGRQRPMIHSLLKICSILEIGISTLLPDEYQGPKTTHVNEDKGIISNLGEVVSGDPISDKTKETILKFLNSKG